MVLTLIQNVALLVLLAGVQRVLSSALAARPRLATVASGVLYGAAAVAGMLTPFRYIPGIIYDGRSIIMSLAGLFGGWPVALIATGIAAPYRVILGGPGTVAGVATILLSAILGVALNHLRRRRPSTMRMIDLLVFGFVVHLGMLAAQFLLLPNGRGAAVVSEIGPTVLTLFPFGTALAARLIIEQQERDVTRRQLARNEGRLRLAMAVADQGTWDYAVRDSVLRLSEEAAHVLGYDAEEMRFGMLEWDAMVHPADRERVTSAFDSLVRGNSKDVRVRYRVQMADGDYRWVLSVGSVIERDAFGKPMHALGVLADVHEAMQASGAAARRLAEAELLARSSEQLLGCRNEDCVYAAMRDFLGSTFPDDVVVINRMVAGGEEVQTHSVLGVDGKMLLRAETIMRKEIVGARFPVTSTYLAALLSGHMQRVEGGLSAVAADELPEAVSRSLERIFGLHEFWTLGIADTGHAYAGVHVITRRPDADVPVGMVEAFAHQCFVTLARIEAASLLAESEERFRTLIEQTDEGVSVGLSDGTMLVYNRAMEEISGYTREEVERDGWFALAFPTPERQAEALQLTQQALAGGAPYVELPIVRKDGEERWVSVATTPVSLDDTAYNMSIFTDITERKQAERAQRESEARFRMLVEAAPDTIFVQADQRFAFINEAGCRLYGASSPEELLGQPVLDRFHPRYHDLLRSRIEALNVNKERQSAVEEVHLRLDGTEVHVEVAAMPIRYEGRDGALVFVRDVTESKKAARELVRYRDHLEELVAERTRELEAANAELERATQAKSMFLAKMSHELRTPLNSIIGFSTILMQGLSGQLDEEQLRQIGIINSSGRQLLAIISDILDLSRIEAGRTELDIGPVDPAEMLAEVADLLRPLADEKGLELRVISAEGVPVDTDAGKLRQILLNLGGNAVKFTDEGYVELTLEYGADGRVAFAVRDTGRGIRGELLERIFESFRQGDSRPGEVAAGTGLGLTISREHARLLGGELRVTSEEGMGSTFTLVLPACLQLAG